MRTRSGKVAIWHKPPFRLMDLATELRLRVFHYASISDVPLMFAYDPSPEFRVGQTLGSTEAEKVNNQHTIRREGCNNRLAILLVSRQVHFEVKPILLQNLHLKLSGIGGTNILQEFGDLPKVWAKRLQYIRHLEIDLRVGISFLFCSARHATQVRAYQPRIVVKAMFKLRALLLNVHSITLINGGGRGGEDAEMGPKDSSIQPIILFLTMKRTRQNLYQMFPRLKDIAVTNEYGTESFARLSTGGWERKYSKEKLGLQCQPHPRNLIAQAKSVGDRETGLSSKGDVRSFGAKPSERQEMKARRKMLRLGM